MHSQPSHEPVLLKEAADILDLRPGQYAVDGTVNGGGHAKEIIRRISPDGVCVGIDLDPELAERAQSELGTKGARIVHGNYADTGEILSTLGLPKADRMFLDLGFSSFHVDASGRGFSFAKDEPLRMTYDAAAEPAADIIRRMSERELADVIFQYSGERFARRIARSVKAMSMKRRLHSTKDLSDAIRAAVPKNYEMRRIDPATRTFQALRIYVNGELKNLERLLGGIPDVMSEDGIVAIISFHSLEDRLVKQYFKRYEKENRMHILTKKPIVPTEHEKRSNPRSRSAKLRAARMIAAAA